ncbi:MAG: hypothetical protein ABI411_10715 [Tahibacter sp.]
MSDTNSLTATQADTEQLGETVALEATDDVAGGVYPIVAAAAGAAAFVSWCASGGYQDSVDLVSGFIEGVATSVN